MEKEVTNKEKGPTYWDEDYVNSQFPESAFSFTRSPQGYIDDNDVISHLKCRKLHDWYLLRKDLPPGAPQIFSEMRVPLPIDSQGLRNYIIGGTLRPVNKESTQPPILLEVEDLQYYTIDFTQEYRGVWVITESAKYWLCTPCRKKIKLKRFSTIGSKDIEIQDGEKQSTDDQTCVAEFPSQAKLHLFHRAQFGLLSNLIDLFIPSESEKDYRKLCLYDHTPEEIFTMLSITNEDILKFYDDKVQQRGPPPPPLHDKPFDLELLLSSKFLHKFIENIHPSFKDTIFFRSLQDREYIDATVSLSLQTTKQQKEWRRSAKQAEIRSTQLSWGKPFGTPSNLKYPLQLKLEYRFAKAKQMANSLLMDPDEDSNMGLSPGAKKTGSGIDKGQMLEF